MSARKSGSTSKKPPESATPETAAANTASKKRKIDWSTIDEQKIPFAGFTLQNVKVKATKAPSQAGKKQKTSKPTEGLPEAYRDAPLDADIVQKNPFAEGEMSQTHYVIKPAAHWESTQRYRKFTISEAEFEVGQTVFVEMDAELQDSDSEIKHWIGRVLEVRAGDAAHVYLRVYWLYRPEDLPGGRQAHHGSGELIASNHMDVIEALTVVDRATVVHWDEDPDKPWPSRDQLFWRQTYDLEKPKAQRLSKLRAFCVDQMPCNPDEPFVQCQSCSQWLHGRCLEEQAAQAAYNEHVKDQPVKGKRKANRKSTGGADFTASYAELGASKVCLTVTDKRPGQKNRRWNVDLNCLLCHALIEKALEDLPPEANTKKQVTAQAEKEIALPSREAPAASEEIKKEDSAVGRDEDILNATTSATAVAAETSAELPLEPNPIARGRGRPPKRKRGRPRTIVYEIVKSEPILAEPAVEPTVVKLEPTVATFTPAPSISVNETVFQSSIRSVKRLLWRIS